MSSEISIPAEDIRKPILGYVRFSRRLRASLIDSIIIVFIIVAALFIAVTMRSDDINRKLGFTVLIALLLYEPLLVSIAGSTVGHYLTNLRVVDNQDHGNISFPKAVARFAIKSALGWFSFITMATTNRHQAVHDLLTESTVQIRDPAKADPSDYVGERPEPLNSSMPSGTRRAAVIGVYLLIAFLLLALAVPAAMFGGVISKNCILADRCSRIDNIWLNVVGIGWLVVSALCIILGWRGRLLGCRAGRAT
jgi:hypothetical protein